MDNESWDVCKDSLEPLAEAIDENAKKYLYPPPEEEDGTCENASLREAIRISQVFNPHTLEGLLGAYSFARAIFWMKANLMPAAAEELQAAVDGLLAELLEKYERADKRPDPLGLRSRTDCQNMHLPPAILGEPHGYHGDDLYNLACRMTQLASHISNEVIPVVQGRLVPTPRTPSDDGQWWHEPSEPRPVEYKYGPLTGQKNDICQWMGEKKTPVPRKLEEKAKRGMVWAIRHGRTTWEVWFKDERAWETTDRKRRYG
jgi:hypothetical protein